MTREVEKRSAPAGSRSRSPARGALLIGVPLALLAAASALLAVGVLVRAVPVVLPGTSLPVPTPVARAIPGLVPHAQPAPAADAAAEPAAPPATTPITILLLGLDRRPHHDPAVDGAPNSDAMHLIRLDPVTHTASVLAIPRDLYVEQPSPTGDGTFWEARINAAYHLGEEYHYDGGGLAFARRVVEYTFHIPVNYVVVVDWVAFADVVDALGGIDLTVPSPVQHAEAFNPRTFDTTYIDIPAGPQHMDSVTALAYARFRSDDENDFGRVRRQQEVMQAAAEEAKGLGWLPQSLSLYRRFRSAVQTDLPLVRAPGVGALAAQIDLDHITMETMAGEQTEAVARRITPWGEDVLVPRWSVMAPIIRGVFPDRALQAEGATVTIINATGLRGQGQRAADYLTRFSLTPDQVAAAGNAPITATTEITVDGSAPATAQRIADWLGIPHSRIERTHDPSAVAGGSVVVTLGRDVRLPDDLRFLDYTLR